MFATREQEINHSAKLNTILSYRDYRCDAYVIVAVRVTNDAPYSLADIQQALLQPRFSLYLGRKSCPLAIPLWPHIVSEKGVGAALNRYDSEKFSGIAPTNKWRGFGEGFGPKPYYIWEGDGFDILPKLTKTRNDMPISRKRWQFAKRTEHQAMQYDEGGATSCTSPE